VTNAKYDTIGKGYADKRRADPRITAQIVEALGDASSVVNVGAGAGSYEPTDRPVVAVERSMEMIRQRSVRTNVVQGDAMALPFADGTFDAAMAILTVHHWPDARAGLAEMQRGASRSVILTHTITDLGDFWLTRDYFPEIIAADLARFEPITSYDGEVVPVPVPRDCTDGFLAAYWARPEASLDPDVRAAMSGFALLDGALIDERIARLNEDLTTGRWDERNGHLRELESIDLGYRLVVQ